MGQPRRVPIRWRDLDGFGHVNNAVYLTYAEEARDAFFKALLDRATVERLVLRRVEADYLSPLTQEDGAVLVEVALQRIGGSSIVTSERIVAASDGRLAASLTSIAVHTNERADATQPLPSPARALLEAQLAAAGATAGQ
jgi:acyl-CoA thioester hydrolase